MQSLHSIVGHSTAKPRVGELRWESPLTTPQQYDLSVAVPPSSPAATITVTQEGTRNPQYTAHKREPAGATREAGGIGWQAVKEATSQAVSEAGAFTCQLIFADHSRKGTCRFNSCCCGTRQGRVEDTVKGKLDSCESNLLVVKSIPRTRGVDPINGTAAFSRTRGVDPGTVASQYATGSFPRTRGVDPNRMLEAHHSGTLSPLMRGYSGLFDAGTDVLFYGHLTTNNPTAIKRWGYSYRNDSNTCSTERICGTRPMAAG